jgi:hypothetical protein
MTAPRSLLSVSNNPANRSLPLSARAVASPSRNCAIRFCASSIGVRRAASRTTRSLISGSACQDFAACSIGGPSHTATTEISGTLACTHGQSG